MYILLWFRAELVRRDDYPVRCIRWPRRGAYIGLYCSLREPSFCLRLYALLIEDRLTGEHEYFGVASAS